MSTPRFLQAFGRLAPLFLPALAVGVVGLVVLRLGKTHPVVGARLRGGPTEGVHALSYRLEVIERLDDTARAVAGRGASVEARLVTGEVMTWRGRLDAEGAAAVAFPPRRSESAGSLVAGPVSLRVTVDGVIEPIAEGSVTVSRARWAGAARRRGGWVEGPRVGSSALRLRAAAARGAFAVPFADPLLVDAHPASGAFAGTITCECDTAKEPRVPSVIFSSHGPGTLPARASVRPLEHATSVPLVAASDEGAVARLDVTLAVVPGALHAELVPEGVRVESPILRDRAYVALVTETERLAGGTVLLHGTDRGTAEGVLAVSLPAVPQPVWAVVSSEPDLGSAALVGWPILLGPEAGPLTAGAAAPMTFDVPDVLVLDSVGSRMKRELGRARRARLLAALFAVSAILLAAVLVARGARVARATLEAHLAASGTDSETTTKVATPDGGLAGLVAVAVLCLVLAATLVGVFAAWV